MEIQSRRVNELAKRGCGKTKAEWRKEKKKNSPSKGLENDTIVRRGDESEACSAEYQHNALGRKAPILLPLRLWR